MDVGHIADDLLTQMYHNSKKPAPGRRPGALAAPAVGTGTPPAARRLPRHAEVIVEVRQTALRHQTMIGGPSAAAKPAWTVTLTEKTMTHGGSDKCEPNLIPLLDLVLQWSCSSWSTPTSSWSRSTNDQAAAAEVARPSIPTPPNIIFLNVSKGGKRPVPA